MGKTSVLAQTASPRGFSGEETRDKRRAKHSSEDSREFSEFRVGEMELGCHRSRRQAGTSALASGKLGVEELREAGSG